MSVGPRVVRRLGRYVICVFLVLVAAGTLLAYRDARAARAQTGIAFSGAHSLYNSFADRLLDPITWSANVRANTDNSGFGQHEPGLAVSPTNPNVVVVANKDYREGDIKHVWIEASQDGGQTWPTQLKMMQGITTENDSDPVVMARDDGRIYVSCLTTGNYGVWITWTDDNGLSFHAPVPIVQNQGTLQDKDWFAIDNNPASPFYHRMYMAWAPGGVVSSYSTDGGLTWTAPQQIPNSGGGPIEYPYPVVAPNGDVFLFHLYDWTNHGSQPSIVKFVKSTDGGVSWGAPVSVATIYQPDSPPRSGDQWRFFSILSAATDPTNDNLVYVAWTDNRNFNTNGVDVMYSASTDHGVSWGQITRLSHDPTGIVRDHITPMLKVDSAGRLNAFWLDRRLDPGNHLFQAWYSSSTDGGASWEADSQVSDAPGLGFDLNVGFPPGSGNAAGDYWGLDTAGGYVYTAWTDTRRGEQDIFTSRGVRGPVTPTNTPTVTPTSTATPTWTATHTTSPTWTPSSTPTFTFTPTPTWTPSLTSTATNTPTTMPTDTQTPTSIETSTGTTTPESTLTAISSATAQPSQTGIVSTATSTATSLATETLTPAVTATGTVSGSPTSTATPCGLSFSDVHSTDYFYEGVQYLVCNGVVSGYADNTFRPYNDVTRAQICKMLVLGFGWPIDTTGGPHFSDVPNTYWAYDYIETVYNRGGPVHIISGYDDGTFRPGNNMTRGQLSKVVALSAQWPLDTTGGPHFTDVTPTNPFYAYIETAYKRGIISGYADRTFRWGNSITRGQTAKILYNTLTQP